LHVLQHYENLELLPLHKCGQERSLHVMDLSSRHLDDTTIHGVLQSITWSLRTTFHTSLRTSPGQLAFGRDMTFPPPILPIGTTSRIVATKISYITMRVRISLASIMIIKLVISYSYSPKIYSVSSPTSKQVLSASFLSTLMQR